MAESIDITVSDCYASFKDLYGKPTDNKKLAEALNKQKEIKQLQEQDIIKLSEGDIYSITINYGIRFMLPEPSLNYSEIIVFLDSRTTDVINFGTNTFIDKQYPMTSVGQYMIKYYNSSKRWICEVKEFGEP